MKNDLTTRTWQDNIWCPIIIILFCTSDDTWGQVAWGRLKRRRNIGSGGGGSGGGGKCCQQPCYLPLTLSPNTRVSFPYELTLIVILVDASPSLTSTFGTHRTMNDFGGFKEKKSSTPPMDDIWCVPLDRLGTLIKTYLRGLVQPIEVPAVSVSGLGVAFEKRTVQKKIHLQSTSEIWANIWDGNSMVMDPYAHQNQIHVVKHLLCMIGRLCRLLDRIYCWSWTFTKIFKISVWNSSWSSWHNTG